MNEPGASINNNNNELLINKMVSLAEEVRQQPPISLRPYLQQISRLVATTTQLYTSISGRDLGSPASVGVVKDKIQRTRRIEASDALFAAETAAPGTAEALRQHLVGDDVDWLETSRDPRTTHLQLIFSLQRASAASRVDVRDRILLACSCHSLSTDFDAFEQSQGWKPKYHTLLDRVRTGQEPAVSKNSPRHQNFLASLDIKGADREKFDAGLRLGTKIRLVEAIGEMCGFGPALGLLLGYECSKLSRVSYKELAAMLALLQRRDATVEKIAGFCNEFDAWWTATRELYHLRNSKALLVGSGGHDVHNAEMMVSTSASPNLFGDHHMQLDLAADKYWNPEPATLHQVGDVLWTEHLDMAGVPGMDLRDMSERRSLSDDMSSQFASNVESIEELPVDLGPMAGWEAAASLTPRDG